MKLKLAVTALAAFLVVLSGEAVIGKYRLAGGSGRLVYKASRMVVSSDTQAARPAYPVRQPLPAPPRPASRPRPVHAPLPPAPALELAHAPPRASPLARA